MQLWRVQKRSKAPLQKLQVLGTSYTNNKNATKLFYELLDTVIIESCTFSATSVVAPESDGSKRAVNHTHVPSTQWQRAK